MKKFKSLLYHELKLSKKGIIIRFGLLLLWSVLMLLTIISSKDNGQDMTVPLENGIAINFFEIINIINMLLCITVSLGIDDVFKADLKSGWLNYSYGLPVTAFDRAAVRFVRRFLNCAVGMAFSFINTAVGCVLINIRFESKYITEQFIFLDMIIISVIIEQFFTLSARSSEELKKSEMQLSGAYMIIFAVVGVVLAKNLKNNILTKIYTLPLVWSVALMILLSAVSFMVTYKKLNKAFGIKFSRRSYKPNKSVQILQSKEKTNRMTGFIYKEFKQSRSILILAAVLPFLTLLFSLCLPLFLDAEENPLDFAAESPTRMLMLCLGSFIISCMTTSVFKGDDKKLWAYFVVSNPKGVKGFIHYKYLFVLSVLGLYTAAGIFADTIFKIICFLVNGRSINSFINAYILIFYLLLFICAIDIPFVIRFGTKKGSFIKTGAMLTISTIFVLGFDFLPENISVKLVNKILEIYHGDNKSLLIFFLLLCPYIVLTVLVGSYRFSCRVFMKGAAEYDR